RSGGLADFKWSSLRIGSGNGNRSDAKGIIVGSHDRQRERRLIKALKLTGRRRFAPASRRLLFQELTKARRSRPAPDDDVLPALRWRCWFGRAIWCSLRQEERHFFGAVYQAGDRRWGHVGPASGRADATASVPSGRRVIAHLGDSTSVLFRLAGAIGGGKTPTPLRTSKKRKPSQECM